MGWSSRQSEYCMDCTAASATSAELAMWCEFPPFSPTVHLIRYYAVVQVLYGEVCKMVQMLATETDSLPEHFFALDEWWRQKRQLPNLLPTYGVWYGTLPVMVRRHGIVQLPYNAILVRMYIRPASFIYPVYPVLALQVLLLADGKNNVRTLSI